MSVFMSKEFNGKRFMIEAFDSASEVADSSKRRTITSSSFTDYSKPGKIDKYWTGVANLDEALELMASGYQPTVDKLKENVKANVQCQAKRISFFNDVVGFAPIVPLAIMGVPQSMQNSYMKPIKAKVINVYYDMTCSYSTKSENLLRVGQEILAAIMELEMQGYKINLYAVQTYNDPSSCDMMVAKVKNSNTPIDLKRISFPLTHTAFFRVIGFDWYSRCPRAKYRSAYGHAIGYDWNAKTLNSMAESFFGKGSIFFSAANVLRRDKDYFKEVLTNGQK